MTDTIQQFDLSVNLLRALLWQYNQAPNLQGIVQNEQDWYTAAQSEFWNNWYRDVFDLRTANDFGCTVWSIILGLPLVIRTPNDPVDNDSWGLGEYRKNFDNGNFSNGQGAFIGLSLSQKRIVLRMRYYQLTQRGTVPEFNNFLKEIFGPGVYVLDGLDMTAEIIFLRTPTSEEKFILKYYDIFLRPAGVELTWSVVTDPAFGFGEYRVNFDHAPFSSQGE